MTQAVIPPDDVSSPRPVGTSAEAPLTLDQAPPKVLGVLDQGALWANLGVSLLGFSGAYVLLTPIDGTRLTLVAAVTAAIVGSLIGTAMVGVAAIPGVRTGAPAMVLLRGLFGARLSYVPTVLNIIQMLGWGAFELWVIARGAQAIFGPDTPYAMWVVIAGLITIVLTIWPLGSIRVLRRFVTVGVVISMVWLSVALFRQLPSIGEGSWDGFAGAVDYVIALSVSWVPAAADFARHSRSGSAAFTGIVGGYTIAQVACLALGVVAFILVGGDESRVWSAFVAAPLGALFFGILVLREADQSFVNVYSTAMSLQNLFPRVDRRIFTVTIGVLTTAIALGVDVTSYAAFLLLIGAVFVPLFGVLAVDYFLLGGAARWNVAEDAPSRWVMIVPWLGGFATWWLLAAPSEVSWWAAIWNGARDLLGFTPAPWMSAALGAFLVSGALTLLPGLAGRIRRSARPLKA